jgi:hypothetical protein
MPLRAGRGGSPPRVHYPGRHRAGRRLHRHLPQHCAARRSQRDAPRGGSGASCAKHRPMRGGLGANHRCAPSAQTHDWRPACGCHLHLHLGGEHPPPRNELETRGGNVEELSTPPERGVGGGGPNEKEVVLTAVPHAAGGCRRGGWRGAAVEIVGHQLAYLPLA